ncbi:MAG: hypothetical protein AB7F67_26055 [Rhodospirillaceae bacterium]
MTDLDTLRGRVEQAEARLKGVHATRERESATLVEMWQQLRARFTAQEEEIARTRGRTAALEAENAELLAMLSALVETIEGNVKAAPESAAPALDPIVAAPVAVAAAPLPPAGPEPAGVAETAAQPEPEPEAGDEPPPEMPALHRDAALGEDDIEALLVEAEEPPPAAPEPPADDAPVGIRSMMSRVQRAIHRSVGDRMDAAPAADMADLLDADTHDDEETIRSMRRELHGLKSRVAASNRRH